MIFSKTFCFINYSACVYNDQINYLWDFEAKISINNFIKINEKLNDNNKDLKMLIPNSFHLGQKMF